MKGVTQTLIEMFVLLAAASAVALAANATRRDGLSISKNYFEKPAIPANLLPQAKAPVSAANEANATTPQTAADQQTGEAASDEQAAHADHIFQVATFKDALDMYSDPMYSQGYCVFIDARNTEQFAKGHIPGARLMNPYYTEQYLPDLLPELEVAERIIAYCEGGDCEDSIFACRELLSAGIPYDTIFLYEGGLHDWEQQGGEMEVGE